MLKLLLYPLFDSLSKPDPMWTDGEFNYVCALPFSGVKPDIVLYPVTQNSWGWWSADKDLWIFVSTDTLTHCFRMVT